MEKENTSLIENLVGDVKKYLDLKLDYYKLEGLEKTASVAAITIVLIILILTAFFGLIFFNVWLAVLLSHYFDSFVKGFSVFMGAYVILALIVIILFKPLSRMLFRLFTRIILNAVDSNEK